MIDDPLNMGYRRELVARALWNCVWYVLVRPSPRICHSWRRQIYRLFGAKLGHGVRIYPAARVWAPWNLVMEDDSCLADWVDCYCVDKVRLGKRAVVSQYTFLCTASHDYRMAERPLTTAPILIGDDAWIAADSFLAPGVVIGDRSVVLARSTIYTSIPKDFVARMEHNVITKERRVQRCKE